MHWTTRGPFDAYVLHQTGAVAGAKLADYDYRQAIAWSGGVASL